MPKLLSTLLKSPPPWFSPTEKPGVHFLGCMVRLVRNLPGRPFPGWSTEDSRQAVVDTLLPAIKKMPGFKSPFIAEMASLSYGERRLLMERKQITSCLAARQKGCWLAINGNQDCSVFLNEEEHLVIHAFGQGADMEGPLRQVEELAEALEKKAEFAFSPSHGYLTSVPSECGEGIQLYCIMHLPTLILGNTLPQVTKAMEKLQLNISPFFPELGDNAGHIFVVYTSPMPLGLKDEVGMHLKEVADALTEQEWNMRRKMLGSVPTRCLILDQISRARGLLQYALLPDYKETVHALSLLRLGMDEGLLESAMGYERIMGELAKLNLTVSPYHLAYHNKLEDTEDPVVPLLRARLVKEFLDAADLQCTDFT